MRDIVLVTGSSSGFGDRITKTLAQAGCVVYATMRESAGRNRAAASDLTSWAAQLPGQVIVLDMDVRDEASVRRAVERIEAEASRIDVVVNNAGVASTGPIEAFDVEQVQAIFDTNVFGALRVDKAVLPGMRARRSGLLVHVSSAVGRMLPGMGSPYSASKWALEGLAEGLAHQLRPFDVDVALIEPGSYPTDVLSKGVVARDTEVAAAYTAVRAGRGVPSYGDGPPPDPQEVADAVLEVIRTPTGARPLRVVVGDVFTAGVAELNEAYERIQAEVTRGG